MLRMVVTFLILVLLSLQPAFAGQEPAASQSPAPLPGVADGPAKPFAEWLSDLKKEAVNAGIAERTVEEAFAGIEPVPVVVERDRTQAERTLPLDTYLKRRLDRKTIRTARQMARFHAGLLARVSKRYSVPSNIIVSIWGLESNFGRFSGVRPTIATLTTLAYDNRRAVLFRGELLDALRILDKGDIEPSRMKGSWAGAMGQPQFMPSAYLKYAQDFDGDGRTDIWASQADAFASIANFLAERGWKPGSAWGRRVRIPSSADKAIADSAPLRQQGCEATRQLTEPLPWSAWKKLGVRVEGRQKPPAPPVTASLVRAGSKGYLVFDNYAALLQYNCANAYALSVGLLADQIAGTTGAQKAGAAARKRPTRHAKKKPRKT